MTRITASKVSNYASNRGFVHLQLLQLFVSPSSCLCNKAQAHQSSLGTAGSLRQQQQQHQVFSVASTLAAAVRPPQPSTVHVERVELNDGLRVAGDDASDSVRRKRSKKHEFEKWERVKGMGSINIVEGESGLSESPAATTLSGWPH